MEEFYGLPPEENIPEESPAPGPGAWPPPDEGAAPSAAGGRTRRRRSWINTRARSAFRRQYRNALLLAVAGLTLSGAVAAAPLKTAAVIESPAETVVVEPAEEPEPEQPVLIGADRLVQVGTWKNSAESEWVHFNADGTGWWYDGTYFGRMRWAEDADDISYEASMYYLSEERQTTYDWVQEKDGETINRAKASGGIALEDADLFTCPGLRYGEGFYAPDDAAIDASVMDGVLGKSNAELVAGTSWHMEQISDLGIPVIYADGPSYDDVVYVQSLDFAAGSICFATRNGAFLVRQSMSADGHLSNYTGEDGSHTLDVSFTLAEDEENSVLTPFYIYVGSDFAMHYLRDYRPGDLEYNINQGGWTFGVNDQGSMTVKLLFTAAGLRLGMSNLDYFPHNYTILAPD